MADEYNQNNNQNNQQRKAIDVTKPRSAPPPQSNIDASRVSAYTLREQQSLEKLKKQVGNLNHKENKASLIKTIVAIILVVLLIILAVVFVIIIGRGSTVEEEVVDMRLSVQIENKSTLSIITETGEEKLREIHPGDRVPLRASVRNSMDIRGDAALEGTEPPAIYVRFKLVLVLGYEERYDIMKPTMHDAWYKYDAETEEKFGANGMSFDDHYYYLKTSLPFTDARELFSAILFDGNVLTCDDGGKYGQIQVHVECIEANINNIISRTFWPTAPQGWISYMVSEWSGGSVSSSK